MGPFFSTLLDGTWRLKTKLRTIISLVLILIILAGCSPRGSFDGKVGLAVKPYRFSIFGWEVRTLSEQVWYSLRDNRKTTDGPGLVLDYVNSGNSIQSLLSNPSTVTDKNELYINRAQQQAETRRVENIIERQVAEVLKEQGIYNPWYTQGKIRISFPAVDIKLETPPHLLVISPRSKIEELKTILLDANMDSATMTAIESEIDKLDVSSLVVNLGGVGTYPHLVDNSADLRFILDTAAHEWAHAYLSFKPLGIRYVADLMGIAKNPDIISINETVADIVGKEIGEAVMQKYYPQAIADNSSPSNQKTFDFDEEMRSTRKNVDQYLANGQVDAAEQYMNQQRNYFQANGYYIRKLNQAYFAFNGQYANVPAFVSPIGIQLNKLRANSATLRDFLNKAASLTSVKELEKAAGL